MIHTIVVTKNVLRKVSLQFGLALVTVAVLIVAMPVPGNSQDLSNLPGQWVTFTQNHGLPSNEVFAVWSGPDGVVWAGTESGLARYDGSSAWQTVKGEAPALNSTVRAIVGQSSTDIWVAGDAGLAHLVDYAWQEIPFTELGLPEGPLYALCVGAQGILWVGGTGGTAYFDGAAWHAFTIHNSGLPANAVNAIACSANGQTIWFGTTKGLARYAPDKDEWFQPQLNNVDLSRAAPRRRTQPAGIDLTDLSISAIGLTETELWAGSNRGFGGLLHGDLTTGQWSLLDGSEWDGPNEVNSIWLSGGELWLAVGAPGPIDDDYAQTLKTRSSSGVRRWRANRWEMYGEESGALHTPYVNRIWSDSQGIFWFATSGGLSRFDSERWRLYTNLSPVGKSLNMARGSASGDLWFVQNSAVYHRQEEQWTRDLFSAWSNPYLTSLWAGSPNDTWLGSEQYGAFHWDGQRWTRFSSEHGLAGDNVRAIWADDHDSVWFGTNQGLSHLVAGQWETPLTTANSGLPEDAVTTIWGDPQTLWIGTQHSDVARYVRATNQWTVYTAANLFDLAAPLALVGDNIRSLTFDKTGNLWVATSGGVAHYDVAKDAWQQWPNPAIKPLGEAVSYNEPHDIAVTSDGTVWITGEADGVFRYLPSKRVWERFAPDKLRGGDINLWLDAQERVWFATWQPKRFDPRTDQWLTLNTADDLVSDKVRAVWGDEAGALWFGTDVGISQFVQGRWQTFTGAEGLRSSNTLLLTGDTDGNVWAATTAGVSHYINGIWETALTSPGNEYIWQDLYAPGKGRLWAVAPDGKLYYFDGKVVTEIAVGDGRWTGQIQSVVEGPQGDLWVGAHHGLAHRSPDGETWAYITPPPLLDLKVNAIWGDGARFVWIATNHGLSRYDVTSDTWRGFTATDGLLHDNVVDLWGDAGRHLWAAHPNVQDEIGGIAQIGGVSVFDGAKWRAMAPDDIPWSSTNSIWGDNNGHLWVATDSGPFRWDGAQWDRLPADPGAPTGNVRDLWAAADGLWIATEAEVLRLAGEQWTAYTTAAGLPQGPYTAVWSDGHGQAWVGGKELAYFDGAQWRQVPLQTAFGEVYAQWGDTAIMDIWGNHIRDMWVGTDNGVAHFDGEHWELAWQQPGGRKLFGDGLGGLWFEGWGSVMHFDRKNTEPVTLPDLESIWARSIGPLPDHGIWIGTDKSSFAITKPGALPRRTGNAVRDLEVDSQGTLWFIDADYQLRHWDQRSPNRDLSPPLLNIGARDIELADDLIAETTNGDIWIGMVNGLLSYRPRQPIVNIAAVTISDGQTASVVGRHITLPYQRAQVTLTAVVTDTASLPEDIHYWYLLNNWDSTWTQAAPLKATTAAGKGSQIQYEALDPGDYTLQLAVYNANKDTSGVQEWKLTVQEPPLWHPDNPGFRWILGSGAFILVVVGGGGLRIWQSRRAYGYRDVELVVEASGEETYQVTWQEQRASMPSYPTQLRRSLVNPYLDLVESDHTGEPELRQLGQQLFRTLWSDATRQKLLEGTRAGHKGWRVRLNFQATPDLLTLPWELADGDAGLAYLGVNPDTALTRYLPPAEPLGRPKTKYPLKVLIVWAEPHEFASTQAEQEVGAVEAALQPLIAKDHVRVRVVPHVTLDAFTRAVSEGADVVHFIGHGAIEAGQSVLYFEDAAGDGIPQGADEFAAVFRGFQAFGDKAPKLVILSACQSAMSAQGSATLAGLVPTLLREGRMPAVVGMQYSVSAQVAASFAGYFYHALVSRGGGQVDYAISVARKGLYTELGAGRRDWSAPVLYMQVKDGRIFEVR